MNLNYFRVINVLINVLQDMYNKMEIVLSPQKVSDDYLTIYLSVIKNSFQNLFYNSLRIIKY